MKNYLRLSYLQFSWLLLLILNFGCSKDENEPSLIPEDGIRYRIEEDHAVVTYIGYHDEITVPSSVEVDGVTYPVTSIAAYAGHGGVKILHLPSSLTSIGKGAFKNSNIEELYLEDLASWCNIYFGFDVNSGNTFIEYTSDASPFRKDTKLYVDNKLVETLIIPDNVKKISNFAFTNINCEKIVIGAGVKTVGVQAFMGSTAREVVIGPKVTDVEQEAFAQCEELKILRLSGKNEKKIGYRSFKESPVSEIHASDWETWLNIKYIWEQLDGGYLGPQISDSYDLYIGDEKLEDMVVPAAKAELNSFCFAGANIRSATFEGGITYPGSFPFWGCSRLESVTFPSSMTKGGCAFEGCVSLREVRVNRATPPKYDTYFGVDTLTPSIISEWLESNKVVREQCMLYVPAESVEIYAQSKGWSSFKEILPITESGVGE